MLIIALALLPVLLVVFYAIWQHQNYWGWQLAKSTEQAPPAAHFPTLALLIPFRNEANNLPALLSDVAAFSYPNLEVIFIDDHSEDGGAAMVGKAASSARGGDAGAPPQPGAAGLPPKGGVRTKQQRPNIRLLSLADHLQRRPVTAYKKEALAYAISQTSAEVIVTTDADCRLPPTFPEDLARAFRAGNDVVCGPVLITPTAGFLASFQALDLIAYQLYTASCVARQNPTLANGACFGFRRQLFHQVSGYAGMDHLPSGDDVLLLHKFAQLPDVQFGWHSGAPVYTNPVISWGALWRQRLRWAGKAGAYVSPALQFGQALAFLTSLGIVVALLLGLLNIWCFLAALIAWLLKSITDHCLLYDINTHYQQKIPSKHLILVYLFYPFYLVAIGTAALLGLRVEWKGRG